MSRKVINVVVEKTTIKSKDLSIATPNYEESSGELAMLMELIGLPSIPENAINLTITTTQHGEITIPFELAVEKEIVDEEAFDYMKVYHSIIIDDADNVTSYDLVLGSKENVITYPVFAVSYVLG